MGDCGIPTLTCVLLILFMAALYAGVSSKEDGEMAKYNVDAIEVMENYDTNQIDVRVARSASRGRTRVNVRNGGQGNENVGDTQETTNGTESVPRRQGGRTNNRRQEGERRPRPEEGRRPRPGGSRDGLPPGVNRRMMRLAEKISNASTPFAARLFRVVTSQSLNNIVMSPFSVHTALTMTMLGARGRTEREMLTVLGHRQVGLRKKKPHQAYKGLLTSLQNVHQDVKIFSANAVFVKPSIPLEDSFRQGLTQMYSATFDSFQLDHPQGPEAPINSWVSNATRDKIQGLLKPGSITPLTALVLINAIYFNASWSRPFKVAQTRPDQFNTLSGGVQTVDMMSGVNIYGYANHYNTEVVELLYKGDRLAMYILLPNSTSNITQLQQELFNPEQGASAVDRMFENLQQESLRLYLPKFRIESGVLDLKQPLQELGMVKAFQGDQADFSGISASGDLHISAVVHKAFIDVNESGTEAAAATAVVFAFRSSPQATREVKVNRPFIFLIRDKVMKEILFIGAYVGQSTP